jgi:hypothetical protein
MRDDTASRRSAAEVAAGRIVEEFLDASMIPDPVRARTYMAPDVKITFTGGRKFNDPAGTAAFNAARYRVVKKKFERTDVVAGGTDEESIVYNTGNAVRAVAERRCLRGQPIRRPFRRAARQDRAHGRLERQRRNPADPRRPRAAVDAAGSPMRARGVGR